VADVGIAVCESILFALVVELRACVLCACLRTYAIHSLTSYHRTVLQADDFIDPSTRAVFLELTALNGNENHFLVATAVCFAEIIRFVITRA